MTSTLQTLTLKHRDKVRLNISTKDGRDYLWSFELFELYGSILEDVAQYAYARDDFYESGLTLREYATQLYNEEVNKFGRDCAISLRPETAVLAVYTDEQKVAMNAERDALPVLEAGDIIEVRGKQYQVSKVSRDKVSLIEIW